MTVVQRKLKRAARVSKVAARDGRHLDIMMRHLCDMKKAPPSAAPQREKLFSAFSVALFLAGGVAKASVGVTTVLGVGQTHQFLKECSKCGLFILCGVSRCNTGVVERPCDHSGMVCFFALALPFVAFPSVSGGAEVPLR